MSLAAYLIEAGLVLAASPWTAWWRGNYFAARWPIAAEWMESTSFLVTVVSVGVVMVVAGLVELRAAVTGRSRDVVPSASSEAGSPQP